MGVAMPRGVLRFAVRGDEGVDQSEQLLLRLRWHAFESRADRARLCAWRRCLAIRRGDVERLGERDQQTGGG